MAKYYISLLLLQKTKGHRFLLLVAMLMMFSLMGKHLSAHTSLPSNAYSYNYEMLGNNDRIAMQMFENHIELLYYSSDLPAKGLDYKVFKFAVIGYYLLKQEKVIKEDKTKLSIIDFRVPSSEKRLYIFDMASGQLLHHTFVAHGQNSGMVYARHFSNQINSLKTSLGFYITEDTYYGQHGYSLKLSGLDRGFNDNVKVRKIVMHGSAHVGNHTLNAPPRVSLSWGCPAVPVELNREIIDLVKYGNCIFAFGHDLPYLNTSKYLNFHKAARYYYSLRLQAAQ